jgi:hypothetical protein
MPSVVARHGTLGCLRHAALAQKRPSRLEVAARLFERALAVLIPAPVASRAP